MKTRGSVQHNAAWEAFATPRAELDGGDIADINPRPFHALLISGCQV